MKLSKIITSVAAASTLAVLSTGAAQALTPSDGNYAPVTGDEPVTYDDTPYSRALVCLADTAYRNRWAAPRVAVGKISDLTGKIDYDTGAKVTQGASLFAMTALGKAGLPVVERYDSSISEIELNYARQHLLSDTPELAGQSPNNYRKIMAGQIAGSSYYIVGGITELNENIASSGVQGVAGYQNGATSVTGNATTSSYVMNVAIDLRLVDTRSQEVVDMVSYQKQVRGFETDLGLTGGATRATGQLSGGHSAMEPLQAAIRVLVERAVYDLAEYAYLGDSRSLGCLPPTTVAQNQ